MQWRAACYRRVPTRTRRIGRAKSARLLINRWKGSLYIELCWFHVGLPFSTLCDYVQYKLVYIQSDRNKKSHDFTTSSMVVKLPSEISQQGPWTDQGTKKVPSRLICTSYLSKDPFGSTVKESLAFGFCL